MSLCKFIENISEKLDKQKQMNMIGYMKKLLNDYNHKSKESGETKTLENESTKETFWSICSSELSDDRNLIKIMDSGN